jgi:hypothetical protein
MGDVGGDLNDSEKSSRRSRLLLLSILWSNIPTAPRQYVWLNVEIVAECHGQRRQRKHLPSIAGVFLIL